MLDTIYNDRVDAGDARNADGELVSYDADDGPTGVWWYTGVTYGVVG